MRRTLLALLSILVAGFGSDWHALRTQIDPQHEYGVAADVHATAEEIIAAGAPTRVAASAERTLVSWVVQSDDDEGPQQAAWRLYDADGGRIAEGRLGQVSEMGAVPTLTRVDDGFLIEGYTGPRLQLLSDDGRLTRLPDPGPVRPTRAGDVLLDAAIDGAQSFYRPADQASYALGRLPTRNPQGVVLDETGTVTVLLPWGRRGGVRLASSPDGVQGWTTTSLPVGPRRFPLLGLAAVPGRLLVVVARDAQSFGVAESVWSRPTAGGAWTSTLLAGIPVEDDELDAALVGDRLLLTSYVRGAYLQQPSGVFARLRLPGQDDSTVLVVGDRLWTLDWRGHALYASDDLGATWHAFRR